MQIVLPRDADPAVHLHAVLNDLRGSPSDVGLRHADEVSRVVCTVLDCFRGAGDGCVARFEPHLHVCEAMLECLIRREWAAERVAVEGPLHGEVEDSVEQSDRLGDLEKVGYLNLTVNEGQCRFDISDCSVDTDLGVIELDRCVLLD
ncbi:hypothetical protein D9M69_647510 [compost metagenome]